MSTKLHVAGASCLACRYLFTTLLEIKVSGWGIWIIDECKIMHVLALCRRLFLQSSYKAGAFCVILPNGSLGYH